MHVRVLNGTRPYSFELIRVIGRQLVRGYQGDGGTWKTICVKQIIFNSTADIRRSGALNAGIECGLEVPNGHPRSTEFRWFSDEAELAAYEAETRGDHQPHTCQLHLVA